MRTQSTRRRNGQRGATVIEFGLAFLLFFTVVYAVMEFGRIVASYNILAGAVREATRYAAVHGSASASPAGTTDITAVVDQWAVGLDTSALTVTPTWSNSKKVPGSTVQVTASYSAAPFTSLILPGNVTLRSSSQMVISQ